jgi:hypothetical protein
MSVCADVPGHRLHARSPSPVRPYDDCLAISGLSGLKRATPARRSHVSSFLVMVVVQRLE